MEDLYNELEDLMSERFKIELFMKAFKGNDEYQYQKYYQYANALDNSICELKARIKLKLP